MAAKKAKTKVAPKVAAPKTKAPVPKTKATETSKGTSKGAPKTVALSTRAVSAAVQPGEGPEVTLMLIVPPLAPSLRVALDGQKTAKECETLGANTQGIGVYREAGAWAAQMHITLTQFPVVQEQYGLGVFAYFLENVHTLGLNLGAQKSTHAASSVSSQAGALSLKVGRETRNKLHAVIGNVLLGNEALEGKFNALRGTADNEDEVSTSLKRSADFGDELRIQSPELAKEFGLTEALTASARAAAINVIQGRTDRSLGGAARATDTPATNRAEGRVLFEMRRAMKVFNAAAEQGYGATLVPGPATRGVLTPWQKKAKPKEA